MTEQETRSELDRVPVKTILVVEDDAEIGEFFVQALQQETAYQTVLATDGFQAFKIVRTLKPDLFVLDYFLPSFNGLELYDQLQTEEAFKTIPTLLMSAHMPPGELERRHIYFIRKPFELEELLHTIEQLLAE